MSLQLSYCPVKTLSAGAEATLDDEFHPNLLDFVSSLHLHGALFLTAFAAAAAIAVLCLFTDYHNIARMVIMSVIIIWCPCLCSSTDFDSFLSAQSLQLAKLFNINIAHLVWLAEAAVVVGKA